MKLTWEMRKWTANDIFAIKPRQGAVLTYIPIEDSLRTQIQAILRSPAPKDDIERLFLLLWVYIAFVLLPYLLSLQVHSVSCAGLMFLMPWIVDAIASAFLVFLAVWSFKEISTQIANLVYFHWFSRFERNDFQRREQSKFYKLEPRDEIRSILSAFVRDSRRLAF